MTPRGARLAQSRWSVSTRTAGKCSSESGWCARHSRHKWAMRSHSDASFSSVGNLKAHRAQAHRVGTGLREPAPALLKEEEETLTRSESTASPSQSVACLCYRGVVTGSRCLTCAVPTHSRLCSGEVAPTSRPTGRSSRPIPDPIPLRCALLRFSPSKNES